MSAAGERCFPTTHWSVVLAAKDVDGAAAAKALESLCRTYWSPIYRFLLRDGFSPADAQDLTQEFLSRLLAADFLQHLRHQRGKFRSFLLTFLKHFLSDERARKDAQKRGGRIAFISLDQFLSEEGRPLDIAEPLSPDLVFDRCWILALLQNALNRLKAEYEDKGAPKLFDALYDLQPGERGEQTYAELGFRLGLSESAVKVAVHRLRERHHEIIREEVAHTVGSPNEVDDEIRNLMAILAA